jgi:hypothetical protein
MGEGAEWMFTKENPRKISKSSVYASDSVQADDGGIYRGDFVQLCMGDGVH